MGGEARESYFRRHLAQGSIDFSRHASVSNAVAPGTLIRATTADCLVRVTDVVVYNAAGVAAVVTFYDEDSNVMLVLSVGAGETAALTLRASLVWAEHDIYARTDQAVNAEVTVIGREIPFAWRL